MTLAWTKPCRTCGVEADVALQPPERRRYLSPNERPSMASTTLDEWLCPNGHHHELTYGEVRALE